MKGEGLTSYLRRIRASNSDVVDIYRENALSLFPRFGNKRASSGIYEPYLGDYTLSITTHSSHAQKLFDIGLLFAFGFDQDEARAFANASIAEDPRCAMCYWPLDIPLGLFESPSLRQRQV